MDQTRTPDQGSEASAPAAARAHRVPEPPEGLIRALQDGKAFAVVGSGLSCAAGAPSWESLLLQLVAEAQTTVLLRMRELAAAVRLAQKGRYLDAASAIKRVLGAEFSFEVARQVRRNAGLCMQEVDPRALTQLHHLHEEPAVNVIDVARSYVSDRPLRPTKSHMILMQLGFRAFITTNYDTLLEDACVNVRPPVFCWSHDDWPRVAQRGEPFILKLHGDIHHTERIILAREDYSQVRFSANARPALKAMFMQSIPFWVGYGHNDPDLDLVLDECHALVETSGGYALTLHSDDGALPPSITPCFLSAHGDMEAFLLKLATRLRVISSIGYTLICRGQRQPMPLERRRHCSMS